jgi:hypothetical protein
MCIVRRSGRLFYAYQGKMVEKRGKVLNTSEEVYRQGGCA